MGEISDVLHEQKRRIKEWIGQRGRCIKSLVGQNEGDNGKNHINLLTKQCDDNNYNKT